MKQRDILDPFDLIWHVPVAGFQWSLGKRQNGSPGTFLVARQTAASKERLYNPLRISSALFRTFSEVTPNKRGVLEFANEYGQLGGPCTETVLVNTPKSLPRSGQGVSLATGETLASWAKEILAMKAFVCLWETIREGDTKTLHKWIQWQNGEVTYDLRVDKYHAGGWLAAADHNPEILDRLPAGNLLMPAQYLLQQELNKRLKQYPATLRIQWDLRSEMETYVMPTSLISALWAQFAFAVGGNHRYRACATCGKWFQVGPTGDMRGDARYCSNACRQRKYRAGKR